MKLYKTLVLVLLARSSQGEPNEESDWHMIVGGWNDDNLGLTSVELFNWKTGEQCVMSSALPNELSAHAGEVLDGVPVICGGFSSYKPQSACYMYDVFWNRWYAIYDLLTETYFAGSTFVPAQGWLLYGGNSMTKSQKLPSLESTWETGPELYSSEVEIGQCAVQVNETTTVFLGGSNDPFAIVTFDWKSMTYTRHPQELLAQRSHSACTLVRGQNGEPLVAIAGGRNIGGKGLEVFNPMDGSVTMLSETLPPEETSGNQLQNAFMIAINGGDEVLIYGGYEGVSTQKEIWKFHLANKSWTLVGNMMEPRDDHFVLPVDGIGCE